MQGVQWDGSVWYNSGADGLELGLRVQFVKENLSDADAEHYDL